MQSGGLRVVLGLYRDNGKENGNYYHVGLYRGYRVVLGLYFLDYSYRGLLGSLGSIPAHQN